MTSKDFIEAEAGNNGSIILYREGVFWKAYENLPMQSLYADQALEGDKKEIKVTRWR